MTKLRIPYRLPIAAGLALAITLGTCASAFGNPLSDKKAQAVAVQKQVEKLNTKSSIAAENYNAAKARYSVLNTKVHKTEKKIAKLRKRMNVLQTHLDTRASDMYREGPSAFLSVLLSVRTFEQFESTVRVLTSLNQQDAETVAQLKEAKADTEEACGILVAAQSDARRQKVAMATNAKAVKTQLAARKQLLAGIKSDIKTLVALEEARQKAEEQARALALLERQRSAARSGSGEYAGIDLGGNPPTSSKGAAAVYWAEKQLGKPYVWAADGPDSFDCSGLTMFAYAKVGIRLDHYSGSQIKQGARVSKSNLQPGDLVFFGSPIHHVGMYVGGGNFIEAPYSGSSVRITRLSRRSDFAGACRP